MKPTPEIRATVEKGAQKIVDRFRRPSDKLAAARYMATMSWLTVASAMADKVIVDYRRKHPEQTYHQTAQELGIHPNTINRAVSRHKQWS